MFVLFCCCLYRPFYWKNTYCNWICNEFFQNFPWARVLCFTTRRVKQWTNASYKSFMWDTIVEQVMCNVLRNTTYQLYCIVLYCIVLCCVVLCCVALRCVAFRCVVLCCAALCCVVMCYDVIWCVVLCCAVLCCAVLCCVNKQCQVLNAYFYRLYLESFTL